MLGPHSASGQKFAEVSDASGLQGYIYIYIYMVYLMG